MINDFLIPVNSALKEFTENHEDFFSLSKKVKFDYIEDSDCEKIIIFGICSSEKSIEVLNEFRIEFYKLRFGDWHSEIYDLGDFLIGNSEQDSIFAIKELVNFYLSQTNTRIILIGDEARQIYWQHLALNKKKGINITNIDSKIPIGNIKLPLSSENYLGKLFQSNQKINEYNHLAYQSYFVSYKELELLDQLDFSYYRLGEVYEKIDYFSPTLQNSNSISINLNSISNFENGLNSREICNLTYFAGLSTKLSIFGLYNYLLIKGDSLNNQLLGQILWYFIESFNNKQDNSLKIDNQVESYILPFQNNKITFYKNKLNNNWSIKIGEASKYLPCSIQDYQEAVNDNLTKRIKFYLKKY